MNFLYNIIVHIAWFLLKIIAIFNRKINLFVDGRKESFDLIAQNISNDDKVIWFHCASLGEFEQGRPLIEKLKNSKNDFKIVLTFFSPSGYEVQKNYDKVDVVAYLPFDTKKNAKKFLNLINPKMAIFVKYEFWPSILKELANRKIHTILVSGVFRSNQVFFKPYGNWIRALLKSFHYFFVQNESSKNLLNKIGFENCSVTGDTRFDRVFEITKQNNHLQFVEDFIKDKFTLVAGSTWPKDEEIIVKYLNNNPLKDQKFIIAPHNISPKGIETLEKSIQTTTTLFSDKIKNNDAQVLIVDTIGLLTKIYSYASVAYVGGGFEKDGIHNILEPATFGIPLIIGPRFEKFQEATYLVDLEGCMVVQNSMEFNDKIKDLYANKDRRIEMGKTSKEFINSNVGATEIIRKYICKNMIDA